MVAFIFFWYVVLLRRQAVLRCRIDKTSYVLLLLYQVVLESRSTVESSTYPAVVSVLALVLEQRQRRGFSRLYLSLIHI